jgi:hypothetical protein
MQYTNYQSISHKDGRVYAAQYNKLISKIVNFSLHFSLAYWKPTRLCMCLSSQISGHASHKHSNFALSFSIHTFPRHHTSSCSQGTRRYTDFCWSSWKQSWKEARRYFTRTKKMLSSRFSSTLPWFSWVESHRRLHVKERLSRVYESDV